jgi:hypothetical protein
MAISELFATPLNMSALPPKADIHFPLVSFMDTANILPLMRQVIWRGFNPAEAEDLPSAPIKRTDESLLAHTTVLGGLNGIQ